MGKPGAFLDLGRRAHDLRPVAERAGPPCAHSQSEMARSLSWMVSGSSSRPRLQAASHRAGQTRLVNSGSGLVSERRFAASAHWPR